MKDNLIVHWQVLQILFDHKQNIPANGSNIVLGLVICFIIVGHLVPMANLLAASNTGSPGSKLEICNYELNRERRIKQDAKKPICAHTTG